jgi:hypothetical protein
MALERELLGDLLLSERRAMEEAQAPMIGLIEFALRPRP